MVNTAMRGGSRPRGAPAGGGSDGGGGTSSSFSSKWRISMKIS